MKHEISKKQGPRDVQVVTKSSIVKELLKANEEESSRVGQSMKPNKEKQEEISQVKPKMNIESNEGKELVVGLSKEIMGWVKVNGKKIAREFWKAQEASMESQEIIVGTKRPKSTEVLAESEGRLQKKNCDGDSKKKENF